MKRLLPITAIALAFLVPLSLHAQRGGMGGRSGGGSPHVSSGFRSGGSGGMRSFAPARPSSPGMFSSAPRRFSSGPSGPRTFALRSGVVTRGFSPVRRSFFPDRRFGFHRFHDRFFFRNSFFFPGCFGCASPFFFGTGFIGDPYFYSSFPGDYYGPPPSQPVVVNSDNSSNVDLANEVGRLSAEVEDLRNEDTRARDDRPSANPNSSLSAKEPAVATIFVFLDGHRISAKNYALAGQTLWIFDEHAARKISLADLDAAATEQANAANGVEFHLPAPPAQH
ncbi:MAG: hypothetical protein WA738_06035 [Candidatus Angelobacter sp.]